MYGLQKTGGFLDVNRRIRRNFAADKIAVQVNLAGLIQQTQKSLSAKSVSGLFDD
jgi:hypothetical protein